jgi:hypothetical protein
MDDGDDAPEGPHDPAFVDSSVNRYALYDIVQQYTDLFRTLFSTLEDRLGPQANRFRARSAFHQNMRETTMFLFFIFAGVTLFRIAGGTYDMLVVVSAAVDTALRAVEIALSRSVPSPPMMVVGGFSVDVLLVASVTVSVLMAVVLGSRSWSDLDTDSRDHVALDMEPELEGSGIEEDTKTTDLSMRLAAHATYIALLTVILSIGFIELLTRYRSIALGWLAFVVLLTLIVALDDEYGGRIRQFGVWVVIGVSVVLAIHWILKIELIGEILTTLGTAISGVESLVLGFVWVSTGTILIVGLWYMFHFWTHKYEEEYLRYVFATYEAVSTEPSAPLGKQDS